MTTSNPTGTAPAPAVPTHATTAGRRLPRRLAVSAGLALLAAWSSTLPPTVPAAPPEPVTAPMVRMAAEVPDRAGTGTTRPRNGAVLVQRGSGDGELTVDNTAGDTDAVVTLSRADRADQADGDGRAVLAIYVRSGATATVTDVPDGSYAVYAEHGRDWDRAAGLFRTPGPTGVFDRRAGFSTEQVSDGVRYTTVTVTLLATDGNARLLPVAGASIPD